MPGLALISIFFITLLTIYSVNSQDCGTNERFYPCGPCETKCSDIQPISCPADYCHTARCGCNVGYIRDDKIGQCVDPGTCS
ncbi:SCO-spondin-like [Microplitis mediator]|uniref:SCO-spondin-like n=1 Tax=Microplitis mediator TaxID=375433 RepID=UPI0025538507|nr:SCO-spondin-like [Microplitis mediator]